MVFWWLRNEAESWRVLKWGKKHVNRYLISGLGRTSIWYEEYVTMCKHNDKNCTHGSYIWAYSSNSYIIRQSHDFLSTKRKYDIHKWKKILHTQIFMQRQKPGVMKNVINNEIGDTHCAEYSAGIGNAIILIKLVNKTSGSSTSKCEKIYKMLHCIIICRYSNIDKLP
jgi:predicted AlkP superfamily phosphohydrolase/phosphomutase